MPYIGNPIYQSAFVTDTFSGNGSTTAFTMSVAPAGTTNVLVAVSGVLQDPSTYGVVGTTLNFSAAPPTGTGNISVRYLGVPATGVTTTAYRTVTEFTATAGQTTFTPPSYTVGFIDVYRNGVLLGSADFTATNGTTIVLANPATAGDLVETISFLVSSVLNAIPNTAGSVSTANIADSAITTAKIAAGAVIQADLATGVAGTGPTFSAYQSTLQSVPNGSATKFQLQSEYWDTASCFDSTTNYRFTPNVAGYYQINGNVLWASSTPISLMMLYKNGSFYQKGFQSANGGSYVTTASISTMVYLNGSTDYVELYIFQNSGGSLNTNASGAELGCVFNGFLARAA
jgi:hypothetical protein